MRALVFGGSRDLKPTEVELPVRLVTRVDPTLEIFSSFHFVLRVEEGVKVNHFGFGLTADVAFRPHGRQFPF